MILFLDGVPLLFNYTLKPGYVEDGLGRVFAHWWLKFCAFSLDGLLPGLFEFWDTELLWPFLALTVDKQLYILLYLFPLVFAWFLSPWPEGSCARLRLSIFSIIVISHVHYLLDGRQADSKTLHLFHLPFFFNFNSWLEQLHSYLRFAYVLLYLNILTHSQRNTHLFCISLILYIWCLLFMLCFALTWLLQPHYWWIRWFFSFFLLFI